MPRNHYPGTRVVVGYDGSSPSELALQAAIDEALTRDVPLHLVCVVELPAAIPVDLDRHQRAAEQVLAEAGTRASTVLGAAAVTYEVLTGQSAGAELVRRCGPSDLLVVGTHGHRPVARMLLGSVSTAVAAHAPCPVLVVRGPRLRRPGPVVVGVDGSAISRAALAFAAGNAAAAGVGVRAVLALPSVTDAWGFATWAGDENQQQARALLAAAVAEVAPTYPTVEFEQLLVQAHPVDALLRHSRDARLAVVGSRGLGGLRAMVLGSVSRELLHRAECPVVVVHRAPGAVTGHDTVVEAHAG